MPRSNTLRCPGPDTVPVPEARPVLDCRQSTRTCTYRAAASSVPLGFSTHAIRRARFRDTGWTFVHGLGVDGPVVPLVELFVGHRLIERRQNLDRPLAEADRPRLGPLLFYGFQFCDGLVAFTDEHLLALGDRVQEF